MARREQERDGSGVSSFGFHADIIGVHGPESPILSAQPAVQGPVVPFGDSFSAQEIVCFTSLLFRGDFNCGIRSCFLSADPLLNGWRLKCEQALEQRPGPLFHDEKSAMFGEDE